MRIDRTVDGAELRAKVLDGDGFKRPGSVGIDRVVRLREDQWAEVTRRVEAAKFWAIPTKSAEDEADNDGDGIVIEGVEAGAYHVVDRWAPDPDYDDLARYLLGLTGIALETTWDENH